MNKFFGFLFVFLFTQPLCFAFPLTTYFGTKPDPQFLKLYYDRLHKTFEQQSTKKVVLSKEEQEYIALCKSTWSKLGVSEHPLHLFEYFSFKYEMQNTNTVNTHFFVGVGSKTPQLLILIEKISKAHGIQLSSTDKETFFGFLWDTSNQRFSTVHLITTAEQLPANSSLKHVFLQHDSTSWLSTRLYVQTKHKDGKTSSWLQIPVKQIVPNTIPPVPLDVVSAEKIVTDAAETFWHYRIKSLAHFLIADSIHPLIEVYHQEFNLYPHSIIYKDSKNFTLHYP